MDPKENAANVVNLAAIRPNDGSSMFELSTDLVEIVSGGGTTTTTTKYRRNGTIKWQKTTAVNTAQWAALTASNLERDLAAGVLRAGRQCPVRRTRSKSLPYRRPSIEASSLPPHLESAYLCPPWQQISTL